MKNIKTVALLIIGNILFACDVVTLEHPIGVPIVEDLGGKLDGVWYGGEDISVLYVKYKSNGILQIAGVEWNEGKFALRDTMCLLTVLDGVSYINLPINFPATDSTDQTTGYVFARYTLTEQWFQDYHYLVLYYPKTEFFKEAVKNGNLKGKIISNYGDWIDIEDVKENVDEFIENHAAQEMFDFSKITVLKRISSEIPDKVFE